VYPVGKTFRVFIYLLAFVVDKLAIATRFFAPALITAQTRGQMLSATGG